MDRLIAKVVNRTIGDTEALLSSGNVRWEEARAEVLRILVDLCEQQPEHETEIKTAFDPFIVRHDQDDAPGPLSKFFANGAMAERQPIILPVRRRHPRFVPSEPKAIMRLPEGREYAVTILNLSLSGICVQSPVKPPLMSEVTVAERPVVVIRHIAEGFAGQFCHAPGEPPIPEFHSI